LGEADSILGQLIERRRLSAGVSVAMHMIGAQRVDGDEENLTLRCGSRWSLASDRWQRREKTQQ